MKNLDQSKLGARYKLDTRCCKGHCWLADSWTGVHYRSTKMYQQADQGPFSRHEAVPGGWRVSPLAKIETVSQPGPLQKEQAARDPERLHPGKKVLGDHALTTPTMYGSLV